MSTKTIHNKYQIEIRASNQYQEEKDREMQGLVQEKEDQNHELSAPRVESMSIKTIINSNLFQVQIICCGFDFIN
jgi:hypothetical protein